MIMLGSKGDSPVAPLERDAGGIEDKGDAEKAPAPAAGGDEVKIDDLPF